MGLEMGASKGNGADVNIMVKMERRVKIMMRRAISLGFALRTMPIGI